MEVPKQAELRDHRNQSENIQEKKMIRKFFLQYFLILPHLNRDLKSREVNHLNRDLFLKEVS